MREIREVIIIRDPETGKEIASCRIRAKLSWYLYPIVFVEEPKYLKGIPSLFAQQGLAQPALPHDQQKDWFYSLFSWKRYKKRLLIPFVANMEYYLLEGRFVNGPASYKFEQEDTNKFKCIAAEVGDNGCVNQCINCKNGYGK